MRRALRSALLAALCAGCGVIDGLRGDQAVPALSARAWHGPVQLDQGLSPQSDQPRVAFGQGRVWVTWQSWDATAHRGSIWVTARSTGGGFETPRQVPFITAFPAGAIFPQLAVGAAGDPVLAIETINADAATKRGIYAARLRGSSPVSLSALVRVDSGATDGPQLSQARSLAVDAAGDAVLAWADAGGVVVSASPAGAADGAGWTAPQLIDGSSQGDWSTVDVVGGEAGGALAGWAGGISPTTLCVAPLGVGAAVTAAGATRTLGSGTSLPGPALALRGRRGMAVWMTANSTALSTQEWRDGAWGATSSIDAGVGYYADVQVAVNAAGKAVAIWRVPQSGGDSYSGVAAGSFWDGSRWSAPEQISLQGTGRKAWWLALDIDDVGTAVASWADFDVGGTYARIFANRLDFRGALSAWKGPEPIDQSSPNAYLFDKPENVRDITVALDPAGAAGTVIYLQHATNPDPTPRTWANWLE